MQSKHVNKKSLTISALVGISAVAAVYTIGCSSNSSSISSSTASMCNVPIEASLSTAERIGGATTSVALYSPDGSEWTLYNIANELRATPIGMAKGAIHGIEVEGYIHDIEVVEYEGSRYALLSMGSEGIAVVNVTDPGGMTVVTSVKVNCDHEGINWAEGGGAVIYDNNISSTRGPVTSLAVNDEGNATVPSLQLLIGDEGYGLHKTALSNLFDATNGRETDGTLLIDGTEAYTLQYAGENAWGGPKSLKLYGEGNSTKLFVAQGFLGMGIYDPVTLEQVGRYNHYTNTGGLDDWFLDRIPVTDVQIGNIVPCIGPPLYNQACYEPM